MGSSNSLDVRAAAENRWPLRNMRADGPSGPVPQPPGNCLGDAMGELAGAVPRVPGRPGFPRLWAAVAGWVALALAGSACGLPLRLAWDASSGGSIAGYYVYSGPTSRAYTAKIDVGNQTSYAIPDAAFGQGRFFAVTAHDVRGIESAYSNEVGVATSAPPPTAVVEYYNAALDHYFISMNPLEMDKLDSGELPGWARTGQYFNAFAVLAPGTRPVCRFYIPPQHGDSHLFSASVDECDAVRYKSMTDPNYSGYVDEAADAFYIGLPDLDSGTCPAGAVEVYRLWNQRAASNHRYTTSWSIRSQMLALGYVAEGYGPDAVSMCAPE
jgi:hypothetical protein